MRNRIIRDTILALVVLCAGPAGAESPVTVEAISAGVQHSLALTSDGTVWQWGTDPQLNLVEPAPVQTPGLTGIVAVSASSTHNLAAKGD